MDPFKSKTVLHYLSENGLKINSSLEDFSKKMGTDYEVLQGFVEEIYPGSGGNVKLPLYYWKCASLIENEFLAGLKNAISVSIKEYFVRKAEKEAQLQNEEPKRLKKSKGPKKSNKNGPQKGPRSHKLTDEEIEKLRLLIENRVV